MAMITPAESKFERDPEEGNFPTGVYNCRLTEVRETGPSANYPNGNPRLIFEFTVDEGPYKGKKTVAFIGKTLHKSKEGKESNLVKWARLMGVKNAEKGFDPDTLVGKVFQVMCELTDATGDKPARAWARTAMAISGAPLPPNGNVQSTTAAAKWFISDGTKDGTKTFTSSANVRDELYELIDRGIPPADRRVKGPDGKIIDGAAWLLANAPPPPADDFQF
jgi:hypothetical protein